MQPKDHTSTEIYYWFIFTKLYNYQILKITFIRKFHFLHVSVSQKKFGCCVVSCVEIWSSGIIHQLLIHYTSQSKIHHFHLWITIYREKTWIEILENNYRNLFDEWNVIVTNRSVKESSTIYSVNESFPMQMVNAAKNLVEEEGKMFIIQFHLGDYLNVDD